MSMENFINQYVYYYAAILNDRQIPVPVKGRLVGFNQTKTGTVAVFLPDGMTEPIRIPEKRVKKTKARCQAYCDHMIASFIKKHEARLAELKSLLPEPEPKKPAPKLPEHTSVTTKIDTMQQKAMDQLYEDLSNNTVPNSIVQNIRSISAENDGWHILSEEKPTKEDIARHDGRILVTDGTTTYQRLYDADNEQFCYLKYQPGVKHDMGIDTNVFAWKPMPEYHRT